MCEENNIQYVANVLSIKGKDNTAIMTHKHEFHYLLIDDGKYLSYEACVAAIAYHATNLCKDNTSTLITKNRIMSIKRLLNLFQSYNDKLEEFEEIKYKKSLEILKE